MGLTFQQKFYSIGEDVFIVHDRSHVGYCKVIAMVEVPEDEKEAQETENYLKRYGFVERMNFDDVILKGYEIMRMIK
jgi:hypothetical protein